MSVTPQSHLETPFISMFLVLTIVNFQRNICPVHLKTIAVMFRRHWSGLPKDATFPSDLKGLGFVSIIPAQTITIRNLIKADTL